MRVVHSRTGLEVPLRGRVAGPTRAEDFMVLSITRMNGHQVRLSVVTGDPQRLKHIVLPVRGHLWWKRVEMP